MIVQTNEFNHSRIQTVLAVAVTSNVPLARAPGNVLLPQEETGLPKDSVANVSQVITLDKTFLHDRVGALATGRLHQVETGLRLILGL